MQTGLWAKVALLKKLRKLTQENSYAECHSLLFYLKPSSIGGNPAGEVIYGLDLGQSTWTNLMEPTNPGTRSLIVRMDVSIVCWVVNSVGCVLNFVLFIWLSQTHWDIFRIQGRNLDYVFTEVWQYIRMFNRAFEQTWVGHNNNSSFVSLKKLWCHNLNNFNFNVSYQ